MTSDGPLMVPLKRVRDYVVDATSGVVSGCRGFRPSAEMIDYLPPSWPWACRGRTGLAARAVRQQQGRPALDLGLPVAWPCSTCRNAPTFSMRDALFQSPAFCSRFQNA